MGQTLIILAWHGMDFMIGQDKIDLSGYGGVTNFFFLPMTQSGADTIVTLSPTH